MEHLVGFAENLHSIAHTYRVPAAKIWRHPNNQALRSARGSGACLRAGDRLHIPPGPTHGPLASHQCHQIQLLRPKVPFSLQLTRQGQPVPHEPYLWLDDQNCTPGQTNRQGLVQHMIRADLRFAILKLNRGRVEIRLHLCTLDPVQTPGGQHQRLTNLGYAPKPLPDKSAQLRFARDLGVCDQDEEALQRGLAQHYDHRPR